MEELSDTDKRTVNRARKLQRFLPQPTFVAEKFTGLPGVYVPLEETLRGFEAILNLSLIHIFEEVRAENAKEKLKKEPSGGNAWMKEYLNQ